MGCDIHSAGLEYRSDKDGLWHRIDFFNPRVRYDGSIEMELVSPFSGRNYILFGVLSGVRYLPSGPMVAHYGIPEDTTITTKLEWEQYEEECGYHTPCYVTLYELIKASKDKTYTKEERRSIKRLIHNIEFMLEATWNYASEDNVRWVFYFDS